MHESGSTMAHQSKDQTDEQFLERVEHPDPNDILCGKDKNCVHAPGSIRFRKIIESYRSRYANCLTKFDKMLITKEIYETLSETSRFLKYNAKEKVWEEISPMAARDKCGHALRFANRLKNKASKKKTETQEYAAPVNVAPSASAATSSGSSSVASVSKSVSPSLVSTTSSSAAAPSTAATLSLSMTPATTTTTTQAALQPAPAPQQHIWGELAKRYNSMWNATQIPALTGNLRAPDPPASSSGFTSSQSAAITALAAAAAVRSNPGLLASLTAAAPAAAAVDAIRQQQNAFLDAVAAASAPPPAPSAQHPRRKPTLDDLCSILNIENLAATSGK